MPIPHLRVFHRSTIWMEVYLTLCQSEDPEYLRFLAKLEYMYEAWSFRWQHDPTEPVKDLWERLTDDAWLLLAFHLANHRLSQRKSMVEGVDGARMRQWRKDPLPHIMALGADLRNGTYRSLPLRLHVVNDPKSGTSRAIGIPTVRDCVVRHALHLLLAPIFYTHLWHYHREGLFVEKLIRQIEEELADGYYRFAVTTNLVSSFSRLDHALLMSALQSRVDDPPVLALVEQTLEYGTHTAHGVEPSTGVLQGGKYAILLHHAYLQHLDRLMTDWLRSELPDCGVYLRGDAEVLVLTRRQGQAEKCRAQLHAVMQQLRLALPEQQMVVNRVNAGFTIFNTTFTRQRDTWGEWATYARPARWVRCASY